MLLAASGCRMQEPVGGEGGTDAEGQLTKVTLQLNWLPEAEHGGYYAALVHGYYREAGLDVEILPGGPSAPVIPLVDRRQVTFGVSNADRVLLGRNAGADVVALMAPMQQSPRCILVHESSGITRLAELQGVTLAVGNSSPFAIYLSRKLPLEDVKLVGYSGSLALFLADPKYAQQGYVFSEPLLAEQQGAKVRSLMVSEIGYNPYTSLLLTQRQLVAESPETVDKMIAASIRGWQKYLESPEETNRYIEQQNSDMNQEALAFGARQIAPLCQPAAGAAFGSMTADRWDQLRRQLAECDLLSGEPIVIADVFYQPATKTTAEEQRAPSQ